DWLRNENLKISLMPSCVEASEGERPVKQYAVASIRAAGRFEKTKAQILVTNKRLIFRAYGRSALGCAIAQKEFDLKEIKGIESRLGRRFSAASLALGLFWVLAASALTFFPGKYLASGSLLLASAISGVAALAFILAAVLSKSRLWLKSALSGAALGMQSAMFAATGHYAFLATLILAAIAALAFACLGSFAPALTISVRTGDGKELQLIGSGLGRVYPCKDVLSLIHEIGAIIRDIQEMGDAGADKWRGEASLVFKMKG
ncbi:MAG: hypothetical protein LBC41_09100, partial [Clostridiales bacterium]|nr:hypothetical protein [Clostridiales bacterium]